MGPIFRETREPRSCTGCGYTRTVKVTRCPSSPIPAFQEDWPKLCTVCAKRQAAAKHLRQARTLTEEADRLERARKSRAQQPARDLRVPPPAEPEDEDEEPAL